MGFPSRALVALRCGWTWAGTAREMPRREARLSPPGLTGLGHLARIVAVGSYSRVRLGCTAA